MEVPKLPPQKIIETDFFLMAFNPDHFKNARPVRLACGHCALTKNQKLMVCPRCTEMFRRSLSDGSEDYDAYINHGKRDTMIWREDPMRQLNEPTDLSGNFLSD